MRLFDEVVAGIRDGSLVIGDSEAVENTRAISLTREQAARISTTEVVAFLEEARLAYAALASEQVLHEGLRFYAWHDPAAGQLRFSVASSGRLPFGDEIQVLARPDRVVHEFLASDYLEGVRWSELEPDEETHSLHPEDRPPLDVYVTLLINPPAGKSGQSAAKIARLIQDALRAATCSDIYITLDLFEQLREQATSADVPALVEAIRKPNIDFAVRELLAEPLSTLGGLDVLGDLLIAFDQNLKDGHDNDSFTVFLFELVEADPEASLVVLRELRTANPGIEIETIDWLTEACEPGA